MASDNQRADLQNQIWKIATEFHGTQNVWDFKQFVLGILFFRFISENFTEYVRKNYDNINYADLDNNDEKIQSIEKNARKRIGYYIHPTHLFINIIKKIDCGKDLHLFDTIHIAFNNIMYSTYNCHLELKMKGIFTKFCKSYEQLKVNPISRDNSLSSAFKKISELKLNGKYDDVYSFLLHKYTISSGYSATKYITPNNVSKLLVKLAAHNQVKINKVYDPALGTGSLLLEVRKQVGDNVIEKGFFGQEISSEIYNLARMNMLINKLSHDRFDIKLGDSLINSCFKDDEPFDVVVSNLPYSRKWISGDDPTIVNDERFTSVEVLPPKSRADFAFILHSLFYLSNKGRAALICNSDIFYSQGNEQKIRKYLVDNKYIETIIKLPNNTLYNNEITLNILVLSKHKTDDTIQFIDATSLGDLENDGIELIMEVFDTKVELSSFSVNMNNVIISRNNYNLSINEYIKN